ncbi:MAG: T9SS type A sorting domain-containing protein [Bacteroidales bacterium]|nr:T9SS type A sorting domain-containing protein [Bacteroidales bacterium]
MKRALILTSIALLCSTLAAYAHGSWDQNWFASPDTATATTTLQATAYPNPATGGHITFRVDGLQGFAEASLVIRNILGATIKVAAVSSTAPTQLNIAELPNGLYFYTIEQNGKQLLTKRFMVKK